MTVAKGHVITCPLRSTDRGNAGIGVPIGASSCLYRWLGVVAFKRLLMRVVRKSPTKPNTVNSHVLGGRSLRHVREFEIKSRRSELIHLVGLAMGMLCLGLRAIDDRLIIAAIIAFALNFPCFALQRFNRARIYRVLQRAPANSHLFLEG